MGKLHVTVDQFAAFISETVRERDTICSAMNRRHEIYWSGSWRDPGFPQDGSHPVICMSWDDAKAYVDWLAKKTGEPYRLLSEAEWEYAARGRTSPGHYPRFWFGNDQKDFCRYGNGFDQKGRDSDVARLRPFDLRSFSRSLHGDLRDLVVPCNDGYAYTSPAGNYRPNAFGLYDMAGNAWQWVEDCWHRSYYSAPANGSAWTSECQKGGHVIRGGAWGENQSRLRGAARSGKGGGRDGGFRVARTLAR